MPSRHSRDIKNPRPWLTTACERLLNLLSASSPEPALTPLAIVPRRLLVVKVFGMGDSIMIRSLIQHLVARNPAIEIGVLVGPATRELMTLGSIARVHQYTQRALTVRSALKTMKELRKYHYDAILNFEQGSTAGSAFLAATGIPLRIGFLPAANSPKAWFLTHGERFQESNSMWRSFVRLAQRIDPGLPDEVMPEAVPCRSESAAWAVGWLRAHGARRRVIAIHLGSQDLEFRRWPIDRFVRLAERLARRVPETTIVLTGTMREQPLMREFMDKYSGHALDASESRSLEETAALLLHCSLLVSNDTGIMHLGAAMGTPTVGLFGPNSPRYWAPVGPRATYVYETRVPCSPCLNLYANRWPLECTNIEKSRCMLDIQVDSVLNAIQRVMIDERSRTANEICA